MTTTGEETGCCTKEVLIAVNKQLFYRGWRNCAINTEIEPRGLEFPGREIGDWRWITVFDDKCL
jgi:hypothetical protein